MKKYSFSLAQVHRVRRAQEDAAKAELMAANNEVQRALTATADSVAKYEQSITPEAGVTGVDAFMRRRYFDELAGQAVAIARGTEAQAEELASLRRAEWSVVATKVKALDRLKERRKAEHQLEADREAEKEVDDLVTGRYMRNRQGGGA